jgi:large subunit ribosomal protein L19
MANAALQNKIPDFRAGDTVTVHYKIIEGDKVRTQPFTGIVISKRGEGVSKTFMVRRIGANGIGVERIFPLASPNIEKLVVEKTGKVRRAKLYYLRAKVGRQATKVKERFGDIVVAPEAAVVEEEEVITETTVTEPAESPKAE